MFINFKESYDVLKPHNIITTTTVDINKKIRKYEK